jgi:beta-lactamase class D
VASAFRRKFETRHAVRGRRVPCNDSIMAAKIVLTIALIVALCQSPNATVAVDGRCVALYDATKGTTWRTDDQTCAVRLSPASTFKIPHALIALETGAIRQDSIEKWDGQRFSRQTAWERDHDLQSAISNSVLWLFQRTAVRIGAARMKSWLQQFAYGNSDASGDPVMYWLNGTLQISPSEQLEFLKRFLAGDLPVSAEHLTYVRRAIAQEPGTVRNSTGLHKVAAPWGHGTEMQAKTGATTAPDGTSISWLVGALNRDGGRHVFVSAVWRAGAVDPLDATKQAMATFVERGLLK